MKGVSEDDGLYRSLRLRGFNECFWNGRELALDRSTYKLFTYRPKHEEMSTLHYFRDFALDTMLNYDFVSVLGLSLEQLMHMHYHELVVLKRRVEEYRRNNPDKLNVELKLWQALMKGMGPPQGPPGR